MKYRYTSFFPLDKTLKWIKKSIISIEVFGSKDSRNFDALVDSGADLCIFDEEIGSYLGIDVRKGKPREVFGVGGKCSVFYIHPIIIEVGGWPFEINAGFMPSVAGKAMPYGLVGQKGFFENFIVKFDLLKEEIEIKNREKH